MDLRSHGKLCAARRVFDYFDQTLRGADSVSFLADLKPAFRMHDDLNVRIPGANFVYVLGQESLMNGAMALPKNHACPAQPLGRDATHDHERVPDHALVQGNAHGKRGVAAKVLVRKKQELLVAFKGPAKRCRRVGRSANHSSALAAKRFDSGGGLHLGQRGFGPALLVWEVPKRGVVPAAFDPSKTPPLPPSAPPRATSPQDHPSLVSEEIRALGHEVDTAEDNVFRVSARALLGKFVGITTKVGEANDLVALVVMAKDESAGSEHTTRRRDAGVHGVLGEHQIVFE